MQVDWPADLWTSSNNIGGIKDRRQPSACHQPGHPAGGWGREAQGSCCGQEASAWVERVRYWLYCGQSSSGLALRYHLLAIFVILHPTRLSIQSSLIKSKTTDKYRALKLHRRSVLSWTQHQMARTQNFTVIVSVKNTTLSIYRSASDWHNCFCHSYYKEAFVWGLLRGKPTLCLQITFSPTFLWLQRRSVTEPGCWSRWRICNSRLSSEYRCANFSMMLIFLYMKTEILILIVSGLRLLPQTL